MFPTSTQRKHWTYSGTTELNNLRGQANADFIDDFNSGIPEEQKQLHFLTPDEERMLLRHFEYVLKEFCAKFQPPMPRYVVGTSMMFFKRFYIYNSVMDYHPKDILLTCVYLACKVEEFNVSIQQFVVNLKGDREKIAGNIISQELLLMHHLKYHLTVHSPYRPLEGLLIDVKTRCPEAGDVEVLRRGAEEFLDRTLNTDSNLIFAPSQIALAALLASASKQGITLDSYVAEKLLGGEDSNHLAKTVEHVKRIRYYVKNIESLNRDEIRRILQKLEKCRNQENNPDSEIYKRKLEESLDEEDDRREKKRRRKAQEEKRATKELIGL